MILDISINISTGLMTHAGVFVAGFVVGSIISLWLFTAAFFGR